MAWIYAIKRIGTKDCYVGQTANLKVRWSGHKSKLRKGSHPNKHLQSAWKKYGEEAFEFCLLDQCFDDVVILAAKEQQWIDILKPRYNKRTVAFSNLGMKHQKMSEEAKRKISEGHKGRKFSESHRKNLSNSRRGRKIPDDVKRKISESLKGRITHEVTREIRFKISRSLVGRPWTLARREAQNRRTQKEMQSGNGGSEI